MGRALGRRDGVHPRRHLTRPKPDGGASKHHDRWPPSGRHVRLRPRFGLRHVRRTRRVRPHRPARGSPDRVHRPATGWLRTLGLVRGVHVERQPRRPVQRRHRFGCTGFAEGFAIAFFNPKIALFLVAVLAQVLQPDMNLLSKTAVGLLGMTIDALWYLLVAVVLTGTPWLDRLKDRAAFIHRLTALVLWGFAASVLNLC